MIQSVLDQPLHSRSDKTFVLKLKHCRIACRSWSRRQRPLDQRENDTKILINALDLLVEEQPLHVSEAALHRLAVQGLQDIHSEKLEFWRQC